MPQTPTRVDAPIPASPNHSLLFITFSFFHLSLTSQTPQYTHRIRERESLAMVLKLKLASPVFYGSSLPRPRIYTDIKFSLDRVDPPLPVLDPLLSWANEAHWSMGGLSFKRLRLQGRIEGHVDELRKINKKTTSSPPPAPIAAKRRRRVVPLIDEDEEEEDLEEVEAVKGKRLVKKLVDEFDRVAAEKEEDKAVASRTRNRKVEAVDEIETLMQVVKEVNNLNLKGKNNSKLKKKINNKNKNEGQRSSPRLAAKV